MAPNEQWLRLKAPEETHVFWLGNGHPWPDDGFAPPIDAARAMLDFPVMWVDMEGYNCGIWGDPPAWFFEGAIIHEEGWFTPSE